MLPLLSPALRAEVENGLTDLERTSVPAFVNIYRALTTRALDHDVSSTAKNAEYESTGVAATLREHHVRIARDAILTRALGDDALPAAQNIPAAAVKARSSNRKGDEASTAAAAAAAAAAEAHRRRELCRFVAALIAITTTRKGGLDKDINHPEIEGLIMHEIEEFRDQVIPDISGPLSSYLVNMESTARRLLELLNTTTVPDSKESGRVGASSRIPSYASRNSSNNHSNTLALRRGHRQPSKRIGSTNIFSTAAAATDANTSSSRSSTPSAATLLKDHLDQQFHQTHTDLQTLLASLSTTVHALLSTQTDLLQAHIRHAETHTHSSLSRRLVSQATFLSHVAQGVNYKSQILALQTEKDIYSGTTAGGKSVASVLQATYEQLVREERVLDEREERLRRALREYGYAADDHDDHDHDHGNVNVGGHSDVTGDGDGDSQRSTIFQHLGNAYRETEAEIEVVKSDIQRLLLRR